MKQNINVNFGMIMSTQIMVKKQNCVIWIKSFIAYIKTGDIFKDIAEDVETRLDTSNYELEDRPLPKGKNKKVTGFMKDELGGKVTTKFAGLRGKTYVYLVDDGGNKKAKGTKKCVIKRNLKSKIIKLFRSNST